MTNWVCSIVGVAGVGLAIFLAIPLTLFGVIEVLAFVYEPGPISYLAVSAIVLLLAVSWPRIGVFFIESRMKQDDAIDGEENE